MYTPEEELRAAIEIRREKLLILLDQSFPGAFISAFIGVIVVTLLWTAQDHTTLLLWLSGIFAIGLSRLYFFFSFRRQPPAGDKRSPRERMFFLVSAAYFAWWGVGGLWIMPDDSAFHQVVVLYFLMGLSGAAVAVFSSVRSHQLWAIVLMLGPALLWFFLQGDKQSIGMALGGAIFLLSASRSSRVLAEALGENIRLKHELIDAKAEAERLAREDDLTRLPNRRAFYEYGEKQAAHARRYDKPLSLLLLDIDHFKKINDSHGHVVGDDALRHVAKILVASLRASDFCGRIGGEEFAVLLPSTSLTQATHVAETLKERLAASPFVFAGGSVSITASFGVSESDEGVNELVRLADAGLYRAKANGRDRVEVGG